MKIKCTLSISISVILIFTPSLLIADTIELKNGQSWSGQIVSQSRTVIQIKTAQGTKILSKTDIRRVKFGVTSQEKAEQARRKQEMLDRQRQLELARQKNQTAKAAADQQKLDDLKKQEAKEAEDLIKREKAVLSAEEEMTRLNSDEADLEKKLEAIRNRKAALEDPNASSDSGEYLWRSALLAGWGQIHAGENLKGLGLMLTTLGTAAYALVRYNNSLVLEKEYSTSQSLWSGYMVATKSQTGLLMRLYMPRGNLDSLNTARSDYANFGIAAGLLYAYNLLDAWLFTGAATGAALENREKQIYTFFTTTVHDRMQAGFMMRF